MGPFYEKQPPPETVVKFTYVGGKRGGLLTAPVQPTAAQ